MAIDLPQGIIYTCTCVYCIVLFFNEEKKRISDERTDNHEEKGEFLCSIYVSAVVTYKQDQQQEIFISFASWYVLI